MHREILKIILKKKAKFRTRKELLYLRKCFKDFKLIKRLELQFTEDLMLTLFREMVYFEKEKDKAVFYEGDKGRRFYIIIEGKVKVLKE